MLISSISIARSKADLKSIPGVVVRISTASAQIQVGEKVTVQTLWA